MANVVLFDQAVSKVLLDAAISVTAFITEVRQQFEEILVGAEEGTEAGQGLDYTALAAAAHQICFRIKGTRVTRVIVKMVTMNS